MKKIFLSATLIFTLSIIISCDDTSIETQNNENYEISGTIDNWTLGTKILKAQAFDSTFLISFLADSTLINPDGLFTLKLKNPSDSILRLYAPWDDTFCTRNIQIDPAGLRTTYMYMNVVNDSNWEIGGIQWKNFDSIVTQGSFWRDYQYFSSDANIYGTIKCIFVIDTLLVDFNQMGMKKGWNKCVVLYDVKVPHFTEIKNIIVEPTGGKWHFTPSSLSNKDHF